MVGTKVVCCSKCGKELFYMADGYKMATKIICIECGNKKIAKAAKKPKTETKTRITAASNYARTKKGIRKDLHPTYSFKSATEANFARILEHLKIGWKFEERAFTFDGYKNKPHVYIIDFELIPTGASKGPKELLNCRWVEVKGYMDAMSRNKLRRLKKHYPEEAKNTVVVVYTRSKKKDIEFCEKLGYRYMCYDELAKEFEPQIPTWE